MFPFLFEFHAGFLDLSLPTFPFLIIAGMALCILLFALLSPDLRQKPVAFVFFLGAVFLSSAVFAKTGQIVIEFLDPANAGKPWYAVLTGAGATVTAGLAGGIAAVLVYAKLDPHRIVTWKVLDTFAVTFPFGHMVGRIGCLLNGCCYGEVCEVHNPFGIHYPDTWIARATDPGLALGPRWPSPLFEAVGLALIGLSLLWIFKKTKSRGQIVPLYMMLYGILRFLVEMTRGDDIRGHFGALSTGQWFAVALFATGIVFMVRYLRAYKKGGAFDMGHTLNGKEVSTQDAFSSNVASTTK